MRNLSGKGNDWIYPLKRSILFGILGALILFVVITVFFIAAMLRKNLIDDSTAKTRELSSVIKSSMRTLMLVRNPDQIQDTIESIAKDKSSIVKAFILDKSGRIAYSSDRGEIGKTLDRYHEKSCHGCHQRAGMIPPENTIILESNGSKLHRNIKVIYNEEACYGCHSASDRIIGKLIIDRSMKGTYATIASVEAVIFGSGLICIIVLIPFLSRILSKGVNKYINEIVNQHDELKMLYIIIERLSKTIDMDELKPIVIQLIRDALDPDEIYLVFHKQYRDPRITVWSGSSNAVTRKKFEKSDSLWPVIEQWVDGKLQEEAISKDGLQLWMPIRKGEINHALIIANRKDGFCDPISLRLIEIMSRHISVAFENALLYHIAITDELTALFTKRYFRTSVNRKFADYERYGEKFSLLMLDIDNFKKVNDTHGHMVGDSVLKNVARNVLISIRDNDLAFRYGGEEFVIILPSTDAEGARVVAERIREEVESRVFEEGTLDLHVTISIGVSNCPGNACKVKELIAKADKALYRAKKDGKNRVAMCESIQE